ncbi:ABC transporter substrate-binding protein [Rhizobacter sp. Root1221]|uniref:ABC transporter substrate-binding protein n=1 Tax=Rhizobacter sp. Root1221 TaxID=1736433 RepID=UPI0006FEC2BC|nr:ABC transporter substrate-binding protein [Rhizobacter sp. Root1221]KQW00634.1 ABC transporter substrate-binding protein [Rhizobacter sp. Root1221]
MTRLNSIGLAAALLFAGAAQAATLKVSCSGLGQELALCKSAAEAWAGKTGNQVEVVSTPNDGSERLALYQQVLSAGSDKIDVFQIDVVWPGLLANHLVDLTPYAKGAEKNHFESMIANNTVRGKLVAMPWFTNAGLLFYRKDLLEKHGQKVPVTWDDLTASATRIQAAERQAGNDKMWGYVWQGRAYEGLTCDAFEWVASFGGGSIVDPSGKVTINNPAAVKALQTAAAWVGTISPKAVLNYGEEEARGVFQAGNAVYMRNWPYAWSLGQGADSPVKGKIGVAVLPKGGPDGRHAATLGGELLAVSKYSRNAALAADLVLYMTSAAVQKERALKASYNPTIGALYKDPDIVAANPFMGELYGTFTSAVGRPATVTASRYNQVSNEFWNAAHDVLSGRAKAPDALKRLDTTLNRLGRGGKWE